MHGAHQPAGRRAQRRAVAGRRRPGRRGGRRHPAHHHPPGPPVPLRPQGRPAPAHRHAERAPGHHAGGVRRRRAQRGVLPGPHARPDQAPVLAAAQALAARFKPQQRRLLRAVGRRREGRHGRGPTPDESSPSTATPTCPGSSRSASPSLATTASTSTARTSASCRSSATACPATWCWSAVAWARATPVRTTPTPGWPRPSSGWRPTTWPPRVEAVITIHRDFGNREDRHRARLKYVVDERGLDWFRAEVERRVGQALDDPRRAARVARQRRPPRLVAGRRRRLVLGVHVRRAGSDGRASAPRCARSSSAGAPRSASPPARTCC